MATSSIFVKVRIDDPKQADAFVDALAAAENKPKRKPTTPVTAPMTDINEIKKVYVKEVPGMNNEYRVINILDLADAIGEENLEIFLSDFF